MSDFGEGTPLLQEIGVEFTTFDLESFRECRQPFQKVLFGVRLGRANAFRQHLHIMQAAERLLHLPEKRHHVRVIVSSRLVEDLRRVAELFQRDPYTMESIGGIQRPGIADRQGRVDRPAEPAAHRSQTVDSPGERNREGDQSVLPR